MRQLNLNLTREEHKNILHKLQHNKHADITKKRVRNNIHGSIENAQQLYDKGLIEPVLPVQKITTSEELQDYIYKIQEKGIYVLDFESTGLDVWNDLIVGVALYVEGAKPAYVPIQHTNLSGVIKSGQLEEEEVKSLLKPLLTDASIKVIGHNLKFDDKLLYGNWGIRLGNVYWDTMIAHHILNENESKGLKDLYHRYIDKNDAGYDYGDLFGNNTPFNFVPLHLATIYGANDGIKTWLLYKMQNEWLNPKHEYKEFRELYKVFMGLEMPLLTIVTDMELRGVQLRVDYFKELEAELTKLTESSRHEMDTIVKDYKDIVLQNETLNRLTKGTGQINYNSPAQLQALLYDVWQLPSVDDRTPRGTGALILKTLQEHDKVSERAKDFISSLLTYKEVEKLLKSFAIKLPEQVEERTGRLHGNFNQVGTKTGRFSSSNPNLQQIPSRTELGRKIRQGFTAKDGYMLIGADYSQAEPRTLASYVYRVTGGTEMKDAYDQGKDLYALMASKIYQLPEEQCMEFDSEGNYQPDGDMRRETVKSVLLGLMYGRGNQAIAEQFNKPIEWANDIVDTFNTSFPDIAKFEQYLTYHAEQLGYVRTITNRKRRLPKMRTANKRSAEYSATRRQVLNSVIQGSAADIVKIAMLRVGNNKRLKELDANMILTIHDELILEAPKQHAEEAGEILSTIMKDTGYELLGVPMKCDVEIMKVWGGE